VVGATGSAVSALLAQRATNVLVLEREKFPDNHIGESFFPGSCPCSTARLGDQSIGSILKERTAITLVARTREP